MAAKFGKREKIIVGVVLGVAAVFAVHALVFQSNARDRDEVKATYEALAAEVRTLPRPSDKPKIDLIESEANENLEVLWKTILKMGILLPQYLFRPADPPWPADPSDMEQMRNFLAAQEAFRKGPLREYYRVVQAVLTEHVRRLVEMKKAYEKGKPWKGDALVGGADMSQGRPTKLTFLGSTQFGWDIPFELPAATMRPKSTMKDQIDRLYDYWDVLSYLAPDSEDFAAKSVSYLRQLEQMGVNPGRLLFTETNFGKMIPLLVKMAWVDLIWSEKEENETFFLRQGQKLTYEMLTEMFAFETPTIDLLLPFVRQLDALERIIPIARKAGVEEIVLVKLPTDLRNIASYQELDIKNIKDKSSGQQAQSRDAGRLTAMIMGGGKPAGPATGAAAPPRPDPLIPQASPGQAILLTMVYLATNEASVRFLYNLANDEQAFRIDGLEIKASEGKVMVALTVDMNLIIQGISLADPRFPIEIVDRQTGEPLSQIGKDLKREHEKQLAEAGLDMNAVVERVRAELRQATSDTLQIDSDGAASTDTLPAADASTTPSADSADEPAAAAAPADSPAPSEAESAAPAAGEEDGKEE